jgi:hypothetical protein
VSTRRIWQAGGAVAQEARYRREVSLNLREALVRPVRGPNSDTRALKRGCTCSGQGRLASVSFGPKPMLLPLGGIEDALPAGRWQPG